MSISPVRTRSSESTLYFQTLPSPILSVLAASPMTAMSWSAVSAATMISSLTFGMKSILYSEPRKFSVLPRWRPKPGPR